VTRRETFVNLASWIKDIVEKTNDQMSIMLVANKCDVNEQERKISKKDGEAFALE